jgi:GT2 family glycosyltransferase
VEKLAIVILNWNGKKWLESFLSFFEKYSADYAIYIADNHSTDDSIQYILTQHPKIQIIENDKNYGFAGGYNEALNKIQGKYRFYGIVNSDIEVSENWIEPLLRTLENKNVFAVQPKIKAQTEKLFFEYAGASGGFIDQNYYPFCRGRIFDHREKDTGQYENEKEVFWASGACFFVNAEKFHALGGFDADFFAHMEEIDLCWRAKLLGYSVFVNPASQVYHVGGGTLDYENPKKTFLNFRNNLFMIHKNHKRFLFFKIIWRMMLDGLAAINFLVRGRFKNLGAILKAHFAYYKSMGALNKKRRIIQENTMSYNKAGLFRGSIIYQYFFKGNKVFAQLNKRLFEE